MNRSRAGRTTIWIGLVALWVSALLALPLAGGDCAGTPETCAAARALATDHVRLLAMMVVLVSVAAIAALRIGTRVASGALVVTAATLVALGLWVTLASTAAPGWLPFGFTFTLPAGVLLFAGGAQRLGSAPMTSHRVD